MKILITGAAGKLGKALRHDLAAAGHQLRLGDVAPIENPEGEPIHLDIADGEAVLRAMEGIEAVAHLAWGRTSSERQLNWIRGNFDVNAKGTYHLLWAAQKCGVSRFVYTSTLSVFGHVANFGSRTFDETTPPKPEDAYGLTKYFGEEACRMFSQHCAMSVIVLRLCNLADDELWQEAQACSLSDVHGATWRAMTTHVSDVARAIHLALTVPNARFEIIHIAADNRGRMTEIQKAKDFLGFWPKRRLDGE
jgi:uronate dehydrogenase